MEIKQLQSDGSEPPNDLSSVIKQSQKQDMMLCLTWQLNEPLLTEADGAVMHPQNVFTRVR